MATLTAYAAPIWWDWLGEHTYVTSDDGHGPWPCPEHFGWTSQGRYLDHGTGEGSKAQCCSEPWSTGGILAYGIDGVCYQMADRVLLPAGFWVHRARNFWLAFVVYGPYGNTGVSWLATRGAFCLLWGSPPFQEPKARGRLRTHMERVNALYTEAATKARESVTPSNEIMAGREHELQTMDQEAVAEAFKLMIEYRLGDDFDPSKVNALLNLRAAFLEQKTPMDEAWSNQVIGGDQFANEVNERFAQFLKEIAEVLGTVDYKKLFGISPRTGAALINGGIARLANRQPPTL